MWEKNIWQPANTEGVTPQLPAQTGVDLQVGLGGQGEFPAADAGLFQHFQKKANSFAQFIQKIPRTFGGVGKLYIQYAPFSAQ